MMLRQCCFTLILFGGALLFAAAPRPASAEAITSPASLSDLASVVGSVLTDADTAGWKDVSASEGKYFKTPVKVLDSSLVFQLDPQDALPMDLLVYLRDGKVLGLSLQYQPPGTAFAKLSEDAQSTLWDNLQQQVSASLPIFSAEPISDPIVDETGGLWHAVADGVRYKVDWSKNTDLMLLLEEPQFAVEHVQADKDWNAAEAAAAKAKTP